MQYPEVCAIKTAGYSAGYCAKAPDGEADWTDEFAAL
jgi:hypothetical protein